MRAVTRIVQNLEKYSFDGLGYKSIHSSSINFIRRRRASPVLNYHHDQEFPDGPKRSKVSITHDQEFPDGPKRSKVSITNDETTKNEYIRMNTHTVSLEHIDIRKSTFILFPGQGSHYIGMGKNAYFLTKVKEMYEEASSILGYDLYNISTEGPIEKLNETKYQQPAILVASLAAVEKLRHENAEAITNCWSTAGFSIGEITALTFGGVLKFSDAIKLVDLRAKHMQIASDAIPSGMMTVIHDDNKTLKLGCEIAEKVCKKNGIENPRCKIANFLLPNCKVIAGNLEALQFLDSKSEDFGIKKTKLLSVSGAFHTRLMSSAMEPLINAIKNIYLEKPKLIIYSNITGKPFQTLGEIKQTIPLSVIKAVKWHQIMEVMYEKSNFELNCFPTTYECGPGKTLNTILKRISKTASEKCFNISA